MRPVRMLTRTGGEVAEENHTKFCTGKFNEQERVKAKSTVPAVARAPHDKRWSIRSRLRVGRI